MRPYEDAASFVEILRHRASDQPERHALTLLDGEADLEVGTLTYRALDERARAIAASLQQMEPAPRHALLVYPPGLEFVAGFWGCLFAGVAAVPVYPPRSKQSAMRVRAIAADSEATVGLTTSALVTDLQRGTSDDPVLNQLLWQSTDTVDAALADNWLAPDLRRESLAFLQYTSGSTGSPKGVMVSHENLLHNSEYIRQCFELSSESVSVTWLPSFHDMGLIDGVLQPFYTGFRGVVMPPVSFLQDPFRWLAAITRYGATHCGGPNFCYDLCTRKVTEERRAQLDLSTWVTAYNGAEPLHRETLERFSSYFEPAGFRPRYFYPCYGMAEATLIITGGRVADEPVYFAADADALARNEVAEAGDSSQRVNQLVGCGRPWLGTNVVIVDPKTLVPAQTGAIGEIWVSGKSLALGYWNRLDATESTFCARLADTGAGPFLRTGDLGFIRGGELFVTGRIKDLIIIRGQNHYPQDIEQTAQHSHPGFRPGRVAAFSIDVDEQERLIVVQEVERSHLTGFDERAALRAMREAVADLHGLQVYRAAFTEPGGVPKTSSGKIRRRATKRLFLKQALTTVQSTGASGPTMDRSGTPGAGTDR